MINSPFVYTGSKFRILDQLFQYFKFNKDNFYDIFVGGGSVYANVLKYYKNIYINDIIEDLVLIHKNITNKEFIESFKKLVPSKENKQKFLELRKSYNTNKSSEKLFALMLSCNNNMIRFNKKGEFNQTFGKRSYNKKTEEKINQFVKQLSGSNINYLCLDFEKIDIKENSFVYLDPPYCSKINGEAGYNNFWCKNDDIRLFNYLAKLKEPFALSSVVDFENKDNNSELVLKMIESNFAYYKINNDYKKISKNKNKKQLQEVVFTNEYKVNNLLW